MTTLDCTMRLINQLKIPNLQAVGVGYTMAIPEIQLPRNTGRGTGFEFGTELLYIHQANSGL